MATGKFNGDRTNILAKIPHPSYYTVSAKGNPQPFPHRALTNSDRGIQKAKFIFWH